MMDSADSGWGAPAEGDGVVSDDTAVCGRVEQACGAASESSATSTDASVEERWPSLF